MDATINFDIMWMQINRTPAISVKLQPLKSMENAASVENIREINGCMASIT